LHDAHDVALKRFIPRASAATSAGGERLKIYPLNADNSTAVAPLRRSKAGGRQWSKHASLPTMTKRRMIIFLVVLLIAGWYALKAFLRAGQHL